MRVINFQESEKRIRSAMKKEKLEDKPVVSGMAGSETTKRIITFRESERRIQAARHKEGRTKRYPKPRRRVKSRRSEDDSMRKLLLIHLLNQKGASSTQDISRNTAQYSPIIASPLSAISTVVLPNETSSQQRVSRTPELPSSPVLEGTLPTNSVPQTPPRRSQQAIYPTPPSSNRKPTRPFRPSR